MSIGAVGLILTGGAIAAYFGTIASQSPTTTSRTSTSSGASANGLASSTTLAASTTTTPQVIENDDDSLVVDPQVTEGPYWVEESLNRSDVRLDPTDGSVQAGTKLTLNLTVRKTTDGVTWSPLTGARVDIWHANYQGLYSDEAVQGTSGKKFLRGYQLTDENGAVQFITVYPGWYAGRTIHIHFRIRRFSGTTTTFQFTSQLFFDDGVTDQVLAQAPYSARGLPDTTNVRDNVYSGGSSDGAVRSNAGALLVLKLAKAADGYTGAFNVGVKGA